MSEPSPDEVEATPQERHLREVWLHQRRRHAVIRGAEQCRLGRLRVAAPELDSTQQEVEGRASGLLLERGERVASWMLR